jgi:hypothetical protein
MPSSARALAVSVSVLVALVGLCPRQAAAEPRANPALAAAPPPRVELTIVATPEIEGLVEARIVSWFQGQSTVAHAARSDTLDSAAVLSRSAEPGIRAWIVLKDPSVGRIFFSVVDPDLARRFLVQDVSLPGGLDELGIEQLAQVVYLSAQALWAGSVESTREEVEEGLRRGEHPEESRVEAPVPPPAPPVAAPEVPPPHPTSRRVEVGSEFALRAQGDEGTGQALGASIGLVWQRERSAAGAQLHVDAFVPRDQSAGDVHVVLGGVGLEAGIAVAFRASKELWLTGEVGPGLDVVRFHTGSIEVAGLRPTSGGLNARPNAYLRIGPRVDLGSISLAAEALLVVQFLATHYDIAQGSTRSRVMIPGAVQPGLALAVSW